MGCSVNFDHIIDPIKLDLTSCSNNQHNCWPVFTTTMFMSFLFFLFFFLLMNSLCVQQQMTIATVWGSDNENSTNDARCIICASGTSFFFFVFFYILTNNYPLFRFYLCFEARVGLMATVGGSGNKNGHKRCIWHCLCPRYVFFSSCFFNILTDDLILAQGGLMTTVGVAAIKTGTNDVLAKQQKTLL
jgi:hypothetical protein